MTNHHYPPLFTYSAASVAMWRFRLGRLATARLRWRSDTTCWTPSAVPPVAPRPSLIELIKSIAAARGVVKVGWVGGFRLVKGGQGLLRLVGWDWGWNHIPGFRLAKA